MKKYLIINGVQLPVIIFTVGLTLSFFEGCSSEDKKLDKPSSDIEQVFLDPNGKFRLDIPAGTSYQYEGTPELKEYDFFVNPGDGSPPITLRLQVTDYPTEEDANLFRTDYEFRFLNTCKCSIHEQGIVRFDNKPSRYYHVSLRNGEGLSYQQHFRKGTQVYILSATGSRSQTQRVVAIFQNVLSTFKFTNGTP